MLGPEGTAGEQMPDSVCQSIKAEGWNTKEALQDDQELFGEKASLHLLSLIGGGEVGCGGNQHN